MYSFFYNFMTTLTGGKKFEDLPKDGSKKVKHKNSKKLLDGKISKHDALVFSTLANRQKNEGFFRHLKRHRKLYALPWNEKQKLIDAEKIRDRDEEFRKQKRLQSILDNSESIEPVNAKQKKTQSQQASQDSSTQENMSARVQKNRKGLSR